MILFLKNRTLSDPDRQICLPSADIDFELAFLQAILVIIFRYYLIFWQNDVDSTGFEFATQPTDIDVLLSGTGTGNTLETEHI